MHEADSPVVVEVSEQGVPLAALHDIKIEPILREGTSHNNVKSSIEQCLAAQYSSAEPRGEARKVADSVHNSWNVVIKTVVPSTFAQFNSPR